MEIDLNAVYDSLPEMSVMGIVSFIASGAMIFGGVVPYIPQYRTIRKTNSCEGFSTFVCFVLLLANLLRVFFWFGKRFELPLLVQSILMIIAMLALVHLCVSVQNQSEIIRNRQRHFRDEIPRRTFYQTVAELDWQYFWKWTDFFSYVEFLLALSAILSVLTYLLIDVKAFVETIGFLAVFIEAMLGTPQLYRNYVNQSTEGMSITMVVMWLCGDTFKTGYFIARSAPVQFWFCGILQIIVDLMILSQVLYYSMYPRRAAPAAAALRHAQ